MTYWATSSTLCMLSPFSLMRSATSRPISVVSSGSYLISSRLTSNQTLHVHVLENRAHNRHREQVRRRQWHHDAGRHVADGREEVDSALGSASSETTV